VTRGTPVKDLAASVHDRLLRLAKDTGRPFGEVLQYFAMERFLYRLGASPQRNRFILKGALMLRTWDAPLARPTMDIDLLGRMENSVQAVVAAVKDCLGAVVPRDGLTFDTDSVKGVEIALDAEYTGVRVLFTGLLGERTRLSMQVDVGFGDPITPGPAPVRFPTLLDFDAPSLLGTTPETTVAEKFHAMVELEMANSRMKDFFDIWMLARTRRFEGGLLARAIEATFRSRSTSLPVQVPVALTGAFAENAAKQVQWRAFLRKSRLESDPLAPAIQVIAGLVMPPTEAVALGAAFAGTWVPGSGWELPTTDR
jgi:hypothetical protein